MDLTQQKLSKSEWEYLEVPANVAEMKILSLIYNSFDDVDYSINESQSLLGYMKLNSDEKSDLQKTQAATLGFLRKEIPRFNLSNFS